MTAYIPLLITRAARTLRLATTYPLSQAVIEKTTGPDLGRLFLGDGATAGGRPVMFRDEASGRNNGVLAKTASYTLAVGDIGKLLTLSGAFALSLPTAAAAGNGYTVYLSNIGALGAGAQTITPNGSEQINGAAASLTFWPGQSCTLICDGAGWRTIGLTTVITAQSLTVNGYRKYSDGRIRQWGKDTSGTAGNRAIAFPVFFGAAPLELSAVISSASTSAAVLESVSIASFDTAGFTAAARYVSGGTPAGAGDNISWIAEGY